MRTLADLVLWAVIGLGFLIACCLLFTVLWMMPGWIRRFCFRLEWRRQAPSRAYWRDHPAGPLAEWEKEARRG